MSIRSVVLSSALLAAPALLMAQSPDAAVPAAAPAVHPRVGNEIELGRQFTTWFLAGRFDSLWVHMNQGMRDDLGTPGAMASMRQQIAERAGEELEVLSEMVMMRNGKPQYWRTARYSMMPEPLMLRWVIVDGTIDGIGINPASQAPPTDPEQ